MLASVNKDQVAWSARLFLKPGSVCEARLLDVVTPDYRLPHTVAGYFDTAEALISEVLRYAPKAQGVYVTMNPVAPALLARAANRLKTIRQREPLTGDRDIVERCFILLDLDPVRPAGISSTDREHQLAFDLAQMIRSYLSDCGFSSPVLADSGNGAHLLYPTQLPPEDGGLVKDLLHSLANRFDSAEVKVDTSVHNAGRIVKLYGSVARKGDDTPGRPHRLSRLLEVPDVLEPVSSEAIRSATGASQDQPSHSVPAKESNVSQPLQTAEGLRDWLLEKGLNPRDPKIVSNGGILIPLEVCPFNPDHRGGSAYVGQLPNGARYFGCHHNSCQGKDWHALRDLLEPGWRSSRKNISAKNSQEASGMIAQDADENSKSTSQATRIVDFVLDNAVLFHSPDGSPHAALQVGGHQEVHALRSRSMRDWCARKYWEAHHSVPGSQALQDALHICGAIAIFEGRELPVCIRIGNIDERIYLDLANETWQAVEIDRQGWRVVDCSPVMFRRPGTLGKLPLPREGGHINDLLKFLNLVSADQGHLMVAFLLGAFQVNGPFPLLNLSGEQGTAKTTATKLIKTLLDPASPLIRSAPRTEQDLLLAAQTNHILAIDNVSRLQPWMSDALCRLSTGGGMGVRRLYSNDEEIVLDAVRPLVLNGIPDFITRPDLLDRAILLELAPIPDSARRTEKEFWADFNALHASLLGAVLTQVSGILGNLSNTRISERPRMADFILWTSAAEPTLGWEPGTILHDYNENHSRGGTVVLEASSVAQALLHYLETQLQHGQSTWRGSASALFVELQLFVSPESDEFPATAHHLSGELRRLAPTLRQQDVHLHFDERAGHKRDRILRIEFAKLGADADLQANSNPNAREGTDLHCQQENSDESASASVREPQTPSETVLPVSDLHFASNK